MRGALSLGASIRGFASFGGNDFLGLIISFLVFLWDFVVEVSFGAGGGSFKSVCIFGGSDFLS